MVQVITAPVAVVLAVMEEKVTVVAGLLALQLALVPPKIPIQVQFHGPVPSTDDGVPLLQRLVVGIVVVLIPCEVPQVALTARVGAVHGAFAPPFDPAQVQFQGPVPETVDGEPVVQRLVVGVDETALLCEVPQTPATGVTTLVLLALQDAVVPPSNPRQFQFHGPEPETDVGDPVEQRPVVGIEVSDVP